MTIAFHPDAEEELVESIHYYNDLEEGLGEDFAMSIVNTLHRIIEFPNGWQIVDDNIRRSLVHRFPFGILYSVDEKHIYVLAVMHLQREPNYWVERK
ncbi:MAG: type II toxin-antitoxin system RelE/ParE family toxin [Candidatus Marinimicrobia bacterium]|nr:type II toxin-antitoxin system RelE/ParE family toxin [Candidatus Neomarinimicrobiota bacterium]